MKFLLILLLFAGQTCVASNVHTVNSVEGLAEKLLTVKEPEVSKNKTDGKATKLDVNFNIELLIKQYEEEQKKNKKKLKEAQKSGLIVNPEVQSAKVLLKKIINVNNAKYFLKIAEEKNEINNLHTLKSSKFLIELESEVNKKLVGSGIAIKFSKTYVSLRVTDINGGKYNVVIQELAPGKCVKEIIEDTTLSPENLKKILSNVGKAIGAFHSAKLKKETAGTFATKPFEYVSKTHGDLHLNNIFYDTNHNIVTLIDVETMADSVNSYKPITGDLEKLFAFVCHRFKPEVYKPQVNIDLKTSVIKPLVEGYMSQFADKGFEFCKYVKDHFRTPSMTSITVNFSEVLEVLREYKEQHYPK